MSDKTQETPAPVTTEETPKENFVQKTVKFFKTRVGKTILIGTGTVVALAGTYVAGFRNGQVDTYEEIEAIDVHFTIEDPKELEESQDEESEETEDEETEEEEN